jgi:hypothetical protein
MRARTAIFLVAALAAAACSDGVRTEVPAGQWGGQNIELQVGDAGARVAFKCGASGILEGRLVLDASGRFEANGSYTPLLINSGPRPSHYEGSVSGGGMTLTVTTANGGTLEIGSFELQYGAAGRFDVCNF